jgi:hypothetical protein
VELGISASVILLGLAIALQAKLPLGLAAGLVGLFGLYHGYAHGAEMPADAAGLAYGLGFLAATAALHVAGIHLGLGIVHLASRSATRFAQAGGAAMAVAIEGLNVDYAGYVGACNCYVPNRSNRKHCLWKAHLIKQANLIKRYIHGWAMAVRAFRMSRAKSTGHPNWIRGRI